MKYIEPLGIPEIQFAHICGADCYEATLPARPSTLEVTYINRGSLCLEQSGTACEARENDIICNFYQSDLHVYSSGFHRHHTVCFHVSFGEARDSGVPGLRIHHLPLLLSAANTSRARELIDRIIEENTLWPQNRLSCAGMFLALLEALDHALNPPESRGRESISVAKAKKYIFTNLGFPIHQRDIANHLGISPQYLCDIFKKAEGMPLMTYINRMKLDKIRQLMANERMHLKNAAAIYGYGDPNYVSRIYKKYYGKNITDGLNYNETQKEKA